MSYIGNSPGVASQRIVSTFTATAGQTVFTPSSGYTLGYIDVYKNGVKLAPTSFTADNGVTVILGSGATLNDVVEVIAYIPRGLSDWLYEIRTPSNVSPNNGGTDINLNPTLTGSPYYSLYGAAMTAAQWQVSLDQNFLNTVINTGDIAGTSVTYAIPGAALGNATTYYWRVRYKDANGVYSAWSAPTSFITEAFTLPAIGAAYGGGYYAGSFTMSGSEYLLIVSPKAYGESALRWKTTATTDEVSSEIDGQTNTQALASLAYPAANFCANLDTGGYTDWYLPATFELEIIYYNLKPTTNPNTTGRGTNAYSVPPRTSNYTSGDPAQTSVLLFQAPSGSEEIGDATAEAKDLWVSTITSNVITNAPTIRFQETNGTSTTGQFLHISKTSTRAFRAVRRILRPV